MNKGIKLGIFGGLLTAPIYTFAALEGVRSLIIAIRDLVKLAIPVAVGLALLFFFWGLAKFILKSGDPKAHEEGKNIMIWGIVALFVMLSVWGIVGFVQSNLGLPVTTGTNPAPNLNINPNYPTPPTGCGTDSMGNPIPMC